MGSPIFATKNFLDEATLSGGSWETTLPLTNLQDRRIARVARSTNDTASNTLITVTLSQSEAVRAIGIAGHNLSLAGRVKIRGLDNITFTRASVATQHDRNKRVADVASGDIRVGHRAAGEDGWTICEKAETNEFTYSEDFTHADWADFGLDQTADAIAGPDEFATVNADKIMATDYVLSAHTMYQNTAPADNIPVVISVYAKAGEYGELYIRQDRKDTGSYLAYFDLLTGVVVSTPVGTTGYIEEMADGWYRCFLVVDDVQSGGNTPFSMFGFSNNDQDSSFTGTPGYGIYLWGAQCNHLDATVGTYLPSYTPTTSAAASKAAEPLTAPLTTVPQPLTIYMRHIMSFSDVLTSSGTFDLLHVGNEKALSAGAYMQLRFTGDSLQLIHHNGTTFQAVTIDFGTDPVTTPVLGDVLEFRGVLYAAGQITLGISINGGAEYTEVGITPVPPAATWAVAVVTMHDDSQNVFKDLRIESGEKTLAEMRALKRGDLFTWAPYESGWINPYEIYPDGSLQAGHPAYGGNVASLTEWTDGLRPDVVALPSDYVEGDQWRFQFDDESNADGYVEIGRVFMGYGYRPSHSISVGARIGFQTSSRSIETDGGATFHNERPRRRKFDFSLNQFDQDESMVYLYDLERIVGTTGQMLFVFDDEDTFHAARRAFLCTLEKMTPLQMARSLWSDHGFSLIEEL